MQRFLTLSNEAFCIHLIFRRQRIIIFLNIVHDTLDSQLGARFKKTMSDSQAASHLADIGPTTSESSILLPNVISWHVSTLLPSMTVFLMVTPLSLLSIANEGHEEGKEGGSTSRTKGHESHEVKCSFLIVLFREVLSCYGRLLKTSSFAAHELRFAASISDFAMKKAKKAAVPAAPKAMTAIK